MRPPNGWPPSGGRARCYHAACESRPPAQLKPATDSLGGFGEYGIYTTTLLGSTDVTTRVVDLQPDELRLFDYGHADLFLGTDAETLVWQPILEWIQTH